jgi:hypothetical protein
VAITVFGLVPWLPLALLLLAVAGWADVISAIFRNSIIRFEAPDRLRGRLSSIQAAVVQSGPRLGNTEAAGHRSRDARARATVLVSGLPGLALDRYLTGDRERTDDAARQLIRAAADHL